MKKRNKIDKKIRRLKDRLNKDARKLAKLTMQLGAFVTGGASVKKRKPRVRSTKGKSAVVSPAPRPTRRRVVTKAAPKPAATQPKSSARAKTKRKLNLTPERRAELSAAMKARWEAKRAAAAGGN